MFKIVTYDKVPYSSRFRFKGRWYKISSTSLSIGEYFTGFSSVRESIDSKTLVGVDLVYTPYNAKAHSIL